MGSVALGATDSSNIRKIFIAVIGLLVPIQHTQTYTLSRSIIEEGEFDDLGRSESTTINLGDERLNQSICMRFSFFDIGAKGALHRSSRQISASHPPSWVAPHDEPEIRLCATGVQFPVVTP